jgi:hypothetical protein
METGKGEVYNEIITATWGYRDYFKNVNLY